MHHDRGDQGGTAADLLSINRESWPVVDIEAEPGAGAGQAFDPDQAHQVEPLTLEAYPALLTSNHAPGAGAGEAMTEATRAARPRTC